MTSTWPTTTLGRVAEFRNGLNYTQSARAGDGLPIIGVRDFQSRSFVDFSDLEELDPNAVDVGDLTVKTGDILFVRSNGNRQLIGRSLLVTDQPARPTTFSGFTIRLRFLDERCDPRFYAYVLRGPLVRQVLSSQGGGTNINNLNQTILARLVVPLPALSIQRSIISVLAAYDDLIGVNRRRIALLESIVRRQFREWFHVGENESVVAGDHGALPQGWAIKRLGEIATPIGNSISPSSVFASQLVSHYSFPAFDEEQLPIDEIGAGIQSNKLQFSAPCILIGKLNPRIPRIWYVPESRDSTQLASTEFVPVQPTGAMGLGVLYSYVTSSSFRDKLRSLSQGTSTSHQRVRPSDMLAIPLIVPTNDLLELAERHFAPAFRLAVNLRKMNARLTEARDFLLPRLVSGELSITKAGRELEAVA